MTPIELYLLAGTIFGVSIIKTYIYVCCNTDVPVEVTTDHIPPKYDEINNDIIENETTERLLDPPPYDRAN